MLHIMLKNLKTTGYPLQLDLFWWLVADFGTLVLLWTAMFAYAYVSIPVLLLRLSSRSTVQSLALGLYCISQLVLCSVPSWILWQRPQMSPILKGAVTMQLSVLFMKMHSFYMTNVYFIEAKEDHILNMSLWRRIANLTEFLCMPTVVYEKSYPRTERIRWRYAIQEWAAAGLCILAMYLIVNEYLVPVMSSTGTLYDVADNLLQLGFPSLVCWLLAFYAVFHCILNGIAEFSRYADREFYLDWWNSTGMDAFWRLWNRTVYKWMLRHIYMESQRRVRFFNRELAALGTYVVTAVFHEMVLINAFALVRPWMFTIILAQVPLIYLTRMPFFAGTRLGNLIMWFGLFIGMPLLELSYAREWSIAHQGGTNNAETQQ